MILRRIFMQFITLRHGHVQVLHFDKNLKFPIIDKNKSLKKPQQFLGPWIWRYEGKEQCRKMHNLY